MKPKTDMAPIARFLAERAPRSGDPADPVQGRGSQAYIADLLSQIRLHMGIGGANFPGAAELYAAAEKIEAWRDANNAR